MQTTGNFIEFPNSRLHYVKSGTGPVPLILFHGFGQSLHTWDAFSAKLSQQYTIYAFDLYFHGDSTWSANHPLQKHEWTNAITLFLQHEKIDRFAVAGYSLGGKFALATVEAFPEKIIKLFLLAPDGISLSRWYRFGTGSALTRSFFKSMITRPKRFNDIVRLLRNKNIVKGGVLRFAESQMDTAEKRKRVYDIWVCFRRMKFDIRKLADQINRAGIPVMVVLGRFDKIITIEKTTPLTSHLNQKQVEIVEGGHNDVIALSAEFFRSLNG